MTAMGSWNNLVMSTKRLLSSMWTSLNSANNYREDGLNLMLVTSWAFRSVYLVSLSIILSLKSHKICWLVLQKIRELISVLDQRKDESIERTFKGVARHFREVFSELVQGGHGYLVMMKKKVFPPLLYPPTCFSFLHFSFIHYVHFVVPVNLFVSGSLIFTNPDQIWDCDLSLYYSVVQQILLCYPLFPCNWTHLYFFIFWYFPEICCLPPKCVVLKSSSFLTS